MKVLVVGSGGREHAICWAIKKSNRVTHLYCAPGNGGTTQVAQNVPVAAHQIQKLARFAIREKIDLTVVGPELPLTLGIVDVFERYGLAIIGPNAAAARLEGSKIFSKEFMQRFGIPTSPFHKPRSSQEAIDVVRSGCLGFPVVIKADGLAAGKGVIIAGDFEKAQHAINQILVEKTLGPAGDQIIIEKYLDGEEASFLVFCDGIHALPMVAAQDHKRVFDNDQGPNTGGMGAYSTDLILSPKECQEVMARIVEPTLEGMASEGTPYRGILYIGLMMTSQGFSVLEYNTRFGDPETQPILFRLESDLLDIFDGILQHNLKALSLKWDPEPSVCVVLAAGGYPGHFEKGKEIKGVVAAEALAGVKVFHSGTESQNAHLVSSAGRVLGVTAKATSLNTAIATVYQAVECIYFDQMHYRHDIGQKGLRKESLRMMADG